MVGARFFLYIGVLGFAILSLWAFRTEVEITATATGKVIPTGKVRVVQNLEGGIVQNIFVQEGEEVAAGQVLLDFEQIASQSEVNEIETRLAYLRAEILVSEALLEKASLNFPPDLILKNAEIIEITKKKYEKVKDEFVKETNLVAKAVDAKLRSVKLVESKISEVNSSLDIINKQISISDDLLVEKITSELAHLDLLRNKQALLLKNKENAEQIDRLEGEIEQLQLEKDLKKISFEREISSNLQILIEEEKKYKNRLIRYNDELVRKTVFSPINGIIKKIHVVTKGGVIKPGQNIFEIVPTQEKLVVEALLPVSDVGFVKTGQKVLLSLKGSSGSHFSPVKGSVIMISPDAIKNENDSELFFVVKIEPVVDRFSSLSSEFKLYPGVVLESNIIIGRRTIFENLLAPFMLAKSKSLRENVWYSK